MTPFRALLSWLVLLVLAFANGALRQFVYPSTLPAFAASQVSAGTAAVAFGVAIWLLLRRWPLSTARHAWATGALWLALTVVLELGLTLREGSWAEVRAQYAFWEGSLWPALLAWILVAPVALSWLRHRGVAVRATLLGALGAWAACGLTFAIARAALGTEAAIWLHLVAAPPIAAVATHLVWRHPRHPGVLLTAGAVAGVPALLDAIVVAPFVERSFAMFASLAGTWIPLVLLLVSSAATGSFLRARPSAAPGA